MSGKSCGGLDAFRLGASFLVVAIHTSPLASFTLTGDFFLTRVAGRLAVPFFFMVTGHFVLSGPLFGDGNRTRIYRMVKKLLQLYALAILLYLPLGWYAGHYQGLTLGDLLRLLVFDGTFYHLWYFPACALGLLLVLCLDRLGKKGLFAGAGVLYLLGLLGDSYFGLTGFCPPLRQGYDGMFQLFSYTRNGLFFAPLFLLLGACLGHREPPAARPSLAEPVHRNLSHPPGCHRRGARDGQGSGLHRSFRGKQPGPLHGGVSAVPGCRLDFSAHPGPGGAPPIIACNPCEIPRLPSHRPNGPLIPRKKRPPPGGRRSFLWGFCHCPMTAYFPSMLSVELL